MADLDDGPDQIPLPADQLQDTAARLLAGASYNLILTHGPKGEYTQHRRHVECSQSVVELWRLASIDTARLWLFAYEDGGRAYLPRVRGDADRRHVLTDDVWLEKRRLITDLYGFRTIVGKHRPRLGKKDFVALTRQKQRPSAWQRRSEHS